MDILRPENKDLMPYNEFYEWWGNNSYLLDNPPGVFEAYKQYLAEHGEVIRWNKFEKSPEFEIEKKNKIFPLKGCDFISKEEKTYLSFEEMRDIGGLRKANLED